jgi:hypothetical protein
MQKYRRNGRIKFQPAQPEVNQGKIQNSNVITMPAVEDSRSFKRAMMHLPE